MELETRAAHGLTVKGRTLSGLALPFGVWADVAGLFEERFAAGAVAVDPGALALYEHRDDRLLGRLGRNLAVESRADGLYYELALPRTTVADDILILVSDGILAGASIGFRADQDEWKDQRRTVTAATLYELTITAAPVYVDTSIAVRSQSKAQASTEAEEILALIRRYK